MKNRHRIGAVCLALFGLWVAYIVFHDEPLDPGFNEFYLSSRQEIPQEQDAAVGVMGLSAPRGADFMAHGRFVANVLHDDDRKEAKQRIEANGKLALTGEPGEFYCWIWPEMVSKDSPCPSEERLQAALEDNAELLGRYRQLYSLPRFGWIEYNEILFMKINGLLAAEVALDLRHGRAETAYRKWRDNHVLLSRAAGSEGTWIWRAIVLVAEGFSLATAELLLHEAPELIETHGAELLDLLKPSGLARWNLEKVMQAEYRLFDSLVLPEESRFLVHPNFIRNRWYRAARAFLAASSQSPADLEARMTAVWEAHGDVLTSTVDYLRDPLNAVYVRIFLQGQLRAWQLVASMIQKDGMMRLLTLRVMIARNSIPDEGIEAFLSKADAGLRNPYTNEPMRWDAEKRTVSFGEPHCREQVCEVRL